MDYKLYVNGLDEKMDQGIPEKHIILLAGTPGAMKSSFAYHFLEKNVKNNDIKALYLTLEQEKENFLYHLNKLGMGKDLGNNLQIFDMTTTREQWLKLSQNTTITEESARDLDTFKRQIETLRGALGFNLLVIDSLPVAEMMFKMKDPREDWFYFFKWLKKLQVTTILITEMSQDSPKYSKNDIDFLADGIIKLSMVEAAPTKTQRHIQLVKMRGVDHSTDPYVIYLKNGAFEASKALSI